MNVEKLAEQYVKRKDLADSVNSQVEEMKKLLTKAVDGEGTPDEKGHRWLTAGKYLLQRQKRQGKKYINRERAEQWARDRGLWEDVKVTREDLDEDRLLGWFYEHQSDDNEKALEQLYDEPAPTYAFMPPVIQENYDY
jgi:hypothetical protein